MSTVGLDAVLRGAATWTVVQADVRAGLALLPDGCVQTVCTSPPYWGLRSYGTNPQVWGGADEDCAHEWQVGVVKGVSGGTASPKVQIKGQANFQIVPDSECATCARCGCWRGELGSEPVHSCGRMESGLVELRDDLTPEEREYVLAELVKAGLV